MTERRPNQPQPEDLLPQLDLEEHLRDPGIKQRFVTTMFEVVAPKYDRFTRAFSLGMDRGWKRQLLGELAREDQGNTTVLDLASGTGDLALGAAACLPHARALGVDVSRRMVAVAEQRRRALGEHRAHFSVGQMLQLPLRSAGLDAVTVGYGIRNAPDHGAALDEIGRVLRPGGRLLILDFYRPRVVSTGGCGTGSPWPTVTLHRRSSITCRGRISARRSRTAGSWCSGYIASCSGASAFT
jgi:demethylmenaquinone methyltransferase/2-methoxy-6-polyprenyl-1,4-benzoquinol methylase